jgi:hypothetical protein
MSLQATFPGSDREFRETEALKRDLTAEQIRADQYGRHVRWRFHPLNDAMTPHSLVILHQHRAGLDAPMSLFEGRNVMGGV